ncbi:MAG: universal stress protein [Hyphomicrobiaceae bacterium]
MFSKIVIAHDGSEGADRALSAAIKLAKLHGAQLHMVSVEELSQFPASVDEVVEEKTEANHYFESLVARATSQARAAGINLLAHVTAGHAVTSIVACVERQRADLLVVGYMGHSALYNRLIGSTTDRLVELAGCTVMVVK